MKKIGAFEVFAETNKKQRILASISESGRLAITQAATDMFGLSKYKYVLQMFDSKNNLIGLKFYTTKNEDGLLKLQTRKGSGVFILAGNFLNHYGLTPTGSVFFPISKSDTLDDTLVINLTKPEQRSYENRKKKK